MKRHELVIALVVGLVLGTGVTVALNGPSIFTLGQSTETVDPGAAIYTVEPLKEPTASSPTPMSTSSPTKAPPTATPTLIPLDVGSEKGEDSEDVLLLYDSTRTSNFDVNFCKIAEYYGLLCKRVALNATDLADESLRDAQGDYFKLIGIGADTLLQSPSLLTDDELGIVQTAVETEGVNLLVSKMNDDLDPTVLVELTDGAILGVTKPQDSSRAWMVSSEAPEIARELAGQVISYTSRGPKNDFALTLGQQSSVTTLITSRDDTGAAYAIFARWKKDRGSIFIDAGAEGQSLEELALKEMYNDSRHFSELVPLMLTMRYALGDEAWHNDHDYANLTIDDPSLVESWPYLDYVELLREMKAHNFHTTIGFKPVNWDTSEPTIVRLFLENPERYSLVQHGNNHDGYEFYRYAVSGDDEYPARPLADQEADIVEGLARMAEHRKLTGIPDDRIMIFPYGISPEPTLVLLKKYNYLATVNGQSVPLDATRPDDWDYGMYQATMDYGNFPTVSRRQAGTYQPFRPKLQRFILELFVDKPALFYSHEHEVFEEGMHGFNVVADRLNDLLYGEVEWRSLGYIFRHCYLEKVNDDGSVDVKMYGNHLIVTNGASDERTYHISKAETLNVPISRLTVNGHQFAYRVEEGFLTVDLRLPADSSVEIIIRYGD